MPLVGVLELASKYRYGLTSRGAPLFLFKPYDQTQPDYHVGSTERDLTRNQIALVDPSSENRGTLVRLFGPVGDPDAEHAALLQHYAPSPPKATEIPESDTGDDENRIPIDAASGWTTFHIDPPGCRDIDDAVAYNHATRSWAITIADAAASVPIDSALDKAARAIGATFYNIEGRALRPMLPAILSEGAASLLPGERRRGLTLFISPSGEETFALSWITVVHSFTYDGFGRSDLAYDLQISRDPHSWIEELMIRYNRAAAAILRKANTGVLRVQAAAVQTLWAKIDPALGFLAAEAAAYEATDAGKEQNHASLGLYCHASSPLRRYADLVNQRALKAILRGGPTAGADVDHLNARAKANKRWTRDLTFMTHVTPGRVHTIEVIWLQAEAKIRVWVPAWKRIITLRHEERHATGYIGEIRIFCDPTRRNWKQRILTASTTTP